MNVAVANLEALDLVALEALNLVGLEALDLDTSVALVALDPLEPIGLNIVNRGIE